jgi:hypothetical protein
MWSIPTGFNYIVNIPIDECSGGKGGIGFKRPYPFPPFYWTFSIEEVPHIYHFLLDGMHDKL